MSRLQFLLFGCLVASICLTSHLVAAKTVFKNANQVKENFKQLNLPAEEIDPNVAPPEPQKIETISPEEFIQGTASASSSGADPAAVVDDVVEEGEDTAAEVIDETINEVDSAGVTAAPVAAAAAQPASTTNAPTPLSSTTVKNEDDQSPISRYCKCTDSHCDCCRTFGIGPIRGPGCAKVTYLGDEKMSVSIKYGDITLATRTISAGKRARPVCVGLPGGYSQFCGRIYGLSKAKENFKACLGFELRADDEVEAALRVSCFKFGPEGLRVAEAEPLPSEVNKPADEDDDDDIFGFGAGGDDDDDDYDADEDDEPEETEADDDYVDDEPAEAPADADYGGFSIGDLLSELADDDEEEATPAAATPVAAASRTPASENKKTARGAQGKEEKPIESAAEAAVSGAFEEAATAATAAPAETTNTKKTKKSKKAKKNKKKKAASATESGFAYEILNGILDFFN